MGDEPNVEEADTGGATAESPAAARMRKVRAARAPKASHGEALAEQSEAMDFDSSQEHSYTIVDVYKARKVKSRCWLGRDVTLALFADVDEWIVTRPDGRRFVATDKEFRERFALTSVAVDA